MCNNKKNGAEVKNSNLSLNEKNVVMDSVICSIKDSVYPKLLCAIKNDYKSFKKMGYFKGYVEKSYGIYDFTIRWYYSKKENGLVGYYVRISDLKKSFAVCYDGHIDEQRVKMMVDENVCDNFSNTHIVDVDITHNIKFETKIKNLIICGSDSIKIKPVSDLKGLISELKNYMNSAPYEYDDDIWFVTYIFIGEDYAYFKII